MSPAERRPRGILKKPADSCPPARGIHWDEDNIMLTESQKGATMKITEPKTPYIRYDSANDILLGSTASVPPIELSSAIDTARMAQQGSSGSVGSVSDTESQGSRRRVSVDDWDDSDDEAPVDPEEAERHKKFEAMRAQHYNMKEALKKGRELAEKATVAADTTIDAMEDDADDEGGNEQDNDDDVNEASDEPETDELFELEPNGAGDVDGLGEQTRGIQKLRIGESRPVNGERDEAHMDLS